MLFFYLADSDMFSRAALCAYEEHMQELIPCCCCGRRFSPDRIGRHEPTCSADPISSAKKPVQEKKVTSVTKVSKKPTSSTTCTQ